jgi:hypothetical protein
MYSEPVSETAPHWFGDDSGFIFIDFVLQEILKECGAVIVNHPGEFSFSAGHCCMIIVHMDAPREECKGECDLLV